MPTRTDAILAAVTAELLARRERFDAADAQGSVKLVVKFSREHAPADTLTFRFAFGTGRE